MAIFSTEKEVKRDITPTIIGNRDSITGEIHAESDVLIDGKFNGDIYAKQSISVIPGGSIEGNFHADKVIVSGKVTGMVRANQVVIKGGGLIEGEIAYRILIIEENGALEGKCTQLKQNVLAEEAKEA